MGFVGFEGYLRPEQKYQAEVDRLTDIAIHVFGSDRGDFLKTLADAWIQANPSEKRILREAWAAIVTKYDLEKDLLEEEGSG